MSDRPGRDILYCWIIILAFVGAAACLWFGPGLSRVPECPCPAPVDYGLMFDPIIPDPFGDDYIWVK